MEFPLMPISLGAQIQIQLSQAPERLVARIVGLEHGKYLLLSVPALSAPDLKSIFSVGKIFIARYLYDGKALGFESSVIDVIIMPTRLVFVKYPKTIEDANLRKHRRSDCYLPAEMFLGEKTGNGFLVDVSKGGCCFNCKTTSINDVEALSIGNSVSVKFSLPGVERKLEATGIIRNVRMDGASIFFGIQFSDINTADKQKISDYLDEMQLYEC